MSEQLVWFVPLVVAMLGVWRPRAGLVALAAALPLFGSPPGGPYLAALDVAGIAAILTAWRAARPSPSPLSWPVAAFVAVSLASLAPLAYHPPSGRPEMLLGLLAAIPGTESWSALYTWRAAADLVLGWGLFLAARRAFSGRSLLPLAWGVLGGLSLTVVLGLAAHSGLLSLDSWRPHHFSDSPHSRLDSLFFLSGWLSQYLVFAAPVAIGGLYLMRRGRRFLGPLLGALILACLVLTQQRGAWVAAVAQLALWFGVSLHRGWWKRLRLRRLALSTTAAIALVAVILAGSGNPAAQLMERARSLGSGLGDRAANWSAAVEMVRERPVLGWGLGAFAPAYDLLHPRGTEGASRHRLTAHNLYLHVAAERGLLGLVSLGLLAWAIAVCLWRPRPGREILALALGVSLLGAAVYGLVQYVYYLRSIAWLLWLLTACVTLIGRDVALPAVDRLSRALVIAALLLLPVRAVLVESPAWPGDRSFGFHEPEATVEGPFEWTAASAARRLPWVGETLILNLANGHPRAGRRPVNVEVGIDGVSVAQLTIPGGWEEHRLELGPPRKEWILLTLEASPAFRPFSDFRRYPHLPPAVDIRLLGVAVREIRWE